MDEQVGQETAAPKHPLDAAVEQMFQPSLVDQALVASVKSLEAKVDALAKACALAGIDLEPKA